MTKRTRKIGGVQVNLIAEFDIDEGARTTLALEANYESWLLLEPIPVPAPRRPLPARPECTLTVAIVPSLVGRCDINNVWGRCLHVSWHIHMHQ